MASFRAPPVCDMIAMAQSFKLPTHSPVQPDFSPKSAESR
jgi:hypothetical protein